MYWYYKYPLYVILCLVLFGLGYLIFRQLSSDDAAGGADTEAVVDAALGTSTSGTSTVAAGLPAQQRRSTANLGTAANLPPAVVELVARQLRAADEQLRQGNLLAARALAERVLAMPEVGMFSPEWRRAADIVSVANTEIFNSDAPAPAKVRYEVRAGDVLVRIANRHNTTVEALMRGNKRLPQDSAKIYPGTILHIYQGDWNIVVDKEHYVLILRDGDKLFKVYDIAIGRQGRTPPGSFVVTHKLPEPTWTPPGRVIPYGDPENVLGTRWLGLRPTGDTDPTLKGYGIHGTWQPETIGTQASEGCVRMRNEDVNELYDIVPTGTEVIIKESQNGHSSGL